MARVPRAIYNSCTPEKPGKYSHQRHGSKRPGDMCLLKAVSLLTSFSSSTINTGESRQAREGCWQTQPATEPVGSPAVTSNIDGMGIFSPNQVKSNGNSLFPEPKLLCSALAVIAPTFRLLRHYTQLPRSLWRDSITPVHRLPKMVLIVKKLQASSLPASTMVYPGGPSFPSPAWLLGWLHVPCPTTLAAASWFGWQGIVTHKKANENQTDIHSKAFGNQVAALYTWLWTSRFERVNLPSYFVVLLLIHQY